MDTEKILLSIIIPVYNVEQYIDKCLNSICSQIHDLDGIELIVVNDGTIDNSMDIVSKYVELTKCITVINQKNQGLSSARNTGMKHAKGKYLWFVDSDDWIHEEALTKCISMIRSNDAEIFMFRYDDYNENCERINIVRREPDINEVISGTEVLLRKLQFVPMQIYLINKKFLIDNSLEFLQGIYHEDLEFAPRMLLAAQRVMLSCDSLYCYRNRTNGSITSTKIPKRSEDVLKMLRNSFNFQCENNSSDTNNAIDYVRYCYLIHFLVHVDKQTLIAHYEDFWGPKDKMLIRTVILRSWKYTSGMKKKFRMFLAYISLKLYKTFTDRKK